MSELTNKIGHVAGLERFDDGIQQPVLIFLFRSEVGGVRS